MTVLRSFTPREVVSELDRYIVGQGEAKRAVAIALRNRWRRQQVPDELREEIAPKNIIMIGPTGVGKTEVARRLAKLAEAPFVKVEALKFTEVGYVGRDVESIVRDLVETAVQIVTDEEKRYSMMYCIYPSHVVGLNPSGVIYMCLRPRSAEHVVTRWGYASFDPKPKRKAIKAALDLYNAINREDREKLESLQRGLQSRFATQSPLGPPDLEGPVWDIYQYLADRLTPKRKPAPRLRRAS